jgi:hypothetical protein
MRRKEICQEQKSKFVTERGTEQIRQSKTQCDGLSVEHANKLWVALVLGLSTAPGLVT